MAKSEPTNLVLEQLRIMRAETTKRFDKLESEFKDEIRGLKTELRGLKLQTIAEVYKANLTVDRKSTRLNSSHIPLSRMPSSA